MNPEATKRSEVCFSSHWYWLIVAVSIWFIFHICCTRADCRSTSWFLVPSMDVYAYHMSPHPHSIKYILLIFSSLAPISTRFSVHPSSPSDLYFFFALCASSCLLSRSVSLLPFWQFSKKNREDVIYSHHMSTKERTLIGVIGDEVNIHTLPLNNRKPYSSNTHNNKRKRCTSPRTDITSHKVVLDAYMYTNRIP